MKTKLIIVLSYFFINTGFSQNKLDSIILPFKKINYNVDSNELFTNIYLTKSNLTEITNKDLLPKGNTIKKYVKISLKYFNYAVTTNATLIEVIIGYTKENNLFVLVDKNFNKTFKDDFIHIIEYPEEMKSKKELFKIAPLIQLDSIPFKDANNSIVYTSKSIRFAPVPSGFKDFFKSKKEIEQSQKMSLAVFDTDLWEADFNYNNLAYYLNITANPLMHLSKEITGTDYLKSIRFDIYLKDNLLKKNVVFGNLNFSIQSDGKKGFSKLGEVFIKPIEFNLEENVIKFIALKNLDSLKETVDSTTIHLYKNKNLATNKWQLLIDTTKPYTLIEFSGSWCSPCKKILPDVKKLYATFKDKMSLKMIAVEESEEVAKNYLKQMQVSFDVMFESLDTAKNISNFSLVQHLKQRLYPSFYLFDKRGNLVFNGSSYSALMQIESIIKASK